MKQIRYPVFFLTEGGTDDSRKDLVMAGILLAKSSRLVGVVSNARPVLEDLSLVEAVTRSI